MRKAFEYGAIEINGHDITRNDVGRSGNVLQRNGEMDSPTGLRGKAALPEGRQASRGAKERSRTALGTRMEAEQYATISQRLVKVSNNSNKSFEINVKLRALLFVNNAPVE